MSEESDFAAAFRAALTNTIEDGRKNDVHPNRVLAINVSTGQTIHFGIDEIDQIVATIDSWHALDHEFRVRSVVDGKANAKVLQ